MRRHTGHFAVKLNSCNHLSVQIADPIITVRNSSRGKVMFSQVSVCPQGGGVHHPPRQADTPPAGRHPLGQTAPSRWTTPSGRHPLVADGYCSGRYASYWNVFLFIWNSSVLVALFFSRSISKLVLGLND